MNFTKRLLNAYWEAGIYTNHLFLDGDADIIMFAKEKEPALIHKANMIKEFKMERSRGRIKIVIKKIK